MTPCLFCKIVRGEVPASVVLESADAVAFLDINPVNKGHVLLVPREHHATLAALPSKLAAATASLLPGLCRAVVAATGAEGFNVVVNDGAVAGQTVEHGHWHVIPRFHGDPVDWPWPHAEYVGDELGQMQFRISRELRGERD